MIRQALLFITLLPMFVVGCEKGPEVNKVVETYDRNCSRPPAGWGTEKDGIGQRPVFSVKVDETGRVSWHHFTDKQTFGEYMQRVGELDPEPHMILEIHGNAPCDRVRETRRIMSASPICKGEYPLCSEGRNWRNWEQHH